MIVSDILDTKKDTALLSIAPSATLTELVTMLSEKKIGALVIVDDDGKLSGIVSERDVVHQCAAGADFGTVTVADVMTKEVITVEASYDMKVVMELMCNARVRHIPVTSEDVIEGIVTIGDIVKCMRDSDKNEFDGFLSRFAAATAQHPES